MPETLAPEVDAELYAPVRQVISNDDLVGMLNNFSELSDLSQRLESLVSYLIVATQPQDTQFYWPITCLLNEMFSFSQSLDLKSSDQINARTAYAAVKIAFFRTEISRLLYDWSRSKTLGNDTVPSEVMSLFFLFSQFNSGHTFFVPFFS